MNGFVNIHAQTNVHMTMVLSSTTAIFNFHLRIGASNLIQSRSKICKQILSANDCISLLPISFQFSHILILHRQHNKLNSLLMMLLLLPRMLAVLLLVTLLVFHPVLLSAIATCFLMHLAWLIQSPHATSDSSRSTRTCAKKTIDDKIVIVKLATVFANSQKLQILFFLASAFKLKVPSMQCKCTAMAHSPFNEQIKFKTASMHAISILLSLV
jgi:hypothetical protein